MLVARIAAARGLALLGSQGLALHWPFCKPPHRMLGFLTVISFPPHRLDDHHWWSSSYASAGRSDLSCKNLTSIGQRNMIAIGTALRQVGLRREAGKRLEVMDEMCLVEVPAVQCEICPRDPLPFFDQTQHFLKAKHAAKHFRRESDGFLEQMDEALRTQAKVCGHLRDGAPLVPGQELGKRERDSRMWCLLPGYARQEEAFEDAHPVVVRLGRLQLLAQVNGGCSPEHGKINDLVG